MIKDDEWRDAQKNFNKQWQEQIEKYHYKALDHQGLHFKQNDMKTLRSKNLLNDIEVMYDEKRVDAEVNGNIPTGSCMTMNYPPKKFILDDATNLIVHHLKRQTSIHKSDKASMKQLLKHFIPDLLFHTRQELSDDEKDDDEDEAMEEEEDDDNNDDEDSSNASGNGLRALRERECKQQSSVDNRRRKKCKIGSDEDKNSNNKTTEGESNENVKPTGKESPHNIKVKQENHSPPINNIKNTYGDDSKLSLDSSMIKSEPIINDSEDQYRLFMCNNNWYLFLRLHQLLCHRLFGLYEHAVDLACEERNAQANMSNETAHMLRLKPKAPIAVEACYPAVLEMVKNLLDGHLEYNTYEETLRETFTIHAYPCYTLDKIVAGIVRQLQHLVCDDQPSNCTSIFMSELERGGAGGSLSSAHMRLVLENEYVRQTEKMIVAGNTFKIYTYKNKNVMNIELISSREVSNNDSSPNGESAESPIPVAHIARRKTGRVQADTSALMQGWRWGRYIEQYLSATESDMLQHRLQFKIPAFILRA